MGYRSEVVSIVYGAPELIDALMVAEKLNGNETLKELDDYITVIEQNGDKFLKLEVDDIKWYQGFPIVDHWYRLLRRADDLELAWELIRSGEDDVDIEHQHGAHAEDTYLSIVKQIQCDV